MIDEKTCCMYGAIDFEGLIVISEEEDSPSDRTSMRAREIGRIDV
jgi:hypothetical protein